jgi:hypothetical protein
MSTKAVPFRGFAALVAAIAAFALVLRYALLPADRWRGRAHGAVAAT